MRRVATPDELERAVRRYGPGRAGRELRRRGLIPPIAGASGSFYDSVILGDSPIAYWPLNETSGTAAADATGNGNTGTYTGSYTLGVAGIGDGETGMSVSGSGYVSIPASAALRPASALSVECWFQVTAINTDMLTVSSYDTVNSDGFYIEATTPGGTVAFDLANAGYSGAHVAINTWTYEVGTWDGTTLRLYNNAGTPTTHAYSGSPWSGTPTFQLGAGGSGAFGLNGVLAKCAFYNYALTATQITTHYNSVLGPTPNPRMVNWPQAMWRSAY